MKLAVSNFKGEQPIVSPRLLPPGFADQVVNANLVSGDLDSFIDIGNPFQLSKPASINTVWLMEGPAPTYWLQFEDAEVQSGMTNIDLALGTVPGDESYRTYITGSKYQYTTSGPVANTAPQQTNLFYATDPSQQGSNAAGAYPYVTFTLGIDAPADPPTVVQPATTAGPSTEYDASAPRSVNNAVVNIVGSGYTQGDILTGNQGTIETGLHGFQVKINKVTNLGAIDTSEPPTLISGGFYSLGGDPPTTSATVTGGTGSGATFDLTVVDNNFPPYSVYNVNNGGSPPYYINWTINLTDNSWEVSSGQGDLTVAYSTQVYGLKTAPSWTYQADVYDNQAASGGLSTDLILYLCGVYNGNSSIVGPGVVYSGSDGTLTLYSAFAGTNGGQLTGTIVQQDTSIGVLPPNTFYRVKCDMEAETASTTPGFNCTATISTLSGTVKGTVSGFVPYGGENLGVGTNHRGNHNDGNVGRFLNVVLSVQSPVTSITETTAYVYTYVTQKGTPPNAIVEESAPSDPSPVVTFYIDTSTNPATISPITVTIPPAPAGEDIASYDLYRLVELSDGSEVYNLVIAGLAASTTSPTIYIDTTLDVDLGVTLPSADWSIPPPNLQGITASPNNFMVGFFGNTLCPSAQGFPFSFPVDYQLATDMDIVAIGIIDATILVLTQGHPYTAWGSDPSALQMSKETANQGCVSKRSAVTHKRLGIVYASGNGLCYYRGQGALDLIRTPNGDPYFSIEQWKALEPSSIIGIIHDDRYWFWYNNGTTKGGYCLDLSPAGFGLIELDFHVTSVYTDPSTDTMYFTPDNSAYPINGSIVSTALNVLSQWEGGTGVRTRSWTHTDNLMPRPVTFRLVQIDAEDFDDVSLTLASETGTAYNAPVTGPEPFIVSPQPGRRWTVSLTGQSRINRIQACESANELTPS
jgi:hypothetical protein